MTGSADDFWVFGYGSLMWRPGFPHVEARHARLHGYHRALCLYSWQHRGTRACPGVVLGLDRGGSCHGMAFRVMGDDRREVIDYLHERELRNYVYIPRWLTARLVDGDHPGAVVPAYAFVVDPESPQYVGKPPVGELARLVRQGHGESGANTEYLANTVAHLEDMGIHDRALVRVLREVEKKSAG